MADRSAGASLCRLLWRFAQTNRIPGCFSDGTRWKLAIALARSRIWSTLLFSGREDAKVFASLGLARLCTGNRAAARRDLRHSLELESTAAARPRVSVYAGRMIMVVALLIVATALVQQNPKEELALGRLRAGQQLLQHESWEAAAKELRRRSISTHYWTSRIRSRAGAHGRPGRTGTPSRPSSSVATCT